ncbi:hypothetical protein [Hymenobacter chitinivorans]|uniref:Uncharacterized protein n=1 Tax=Hymenobacter chitinivorans DSM 11115 TaxID=1121954 RepID=A0A2M9BRC9_9BACT|nr:hypothetical protein [Hymenobacter chitinivorans]PJJ60514.1 hypothetical protein CLV45_1943 [Hymenobacter chitinivorans DSM 11115]
MQPEDIDKLFRDQLQHHAPTPPAYLWNQLEEEIRPARKRPVMWLYAAAAMIALLIVAGGAWLLRPAGPGLTTGTLATTTTTASSAIAPAKTAASNNEEKSTTQATAPNELPSSGVEGSATEVAAVQAPASKTKPLAAASQRRAAAGASQPALLAQTSPQPTKASHRAAVPAPALAATSSLVAPQPERRPDEAVAVVEPTPASPAPAGPIEVEVHRGTEAPVVALAAADARQSYESDSHLKNLFHKAKTAVKDGRVKLPKVELPETVTVQVNVFNHSATKVIQL